ncbi:MAG: molybdenum cofactor biosynthesis protein MoaE [Thiomargarita sp.]|nr:molybdenum cofactor biosynthesis protein MoaE [Thiomargarita sp.]
MEDKVKIEITANAFNPWQQLQSYEKILNDKYAGVYGAANIFVGTMRNYNEGDTVQSLFLEHYAGMTENYLAKVSKIALERWEIIDTLIIHRVGEIHLGETIVLIATWSGHRQAAFESCRFLIEELKSHAPFWKRETLQNNSVRWVKG